jgi:hypothetical protein
MAAAVHRYTDAGPPIGPPTAVAAEAATLLAALKEELQAALDSAGDHGHFDTHLALRQIKRLVRCSVRTAGVLPCGRTPPYRHPCLYASCSRVLTVVLPPHHAVPQNALTALKFELDDASWAFCVNALLRIALAEGVELPRQVCARHGGL